MDTSTRPFHFHVLTRFHLFVSSSHIGSYLQLRGYMLRYLSLLHKNLGGVVSETFLSLVQFISKGTFWGRVGVRTRGV